MKTVNNPKPSIVTCFKCVCIMMEKGKPAKPTNPAQLEMDPEGYFFNIAKKDLLSNPNKLLKDLIEFDKDNIADETVRKVIPLMDLPEMA